MMTKFKVGDKVRILDACKIQGAEGNDVVTGGIYDVNDLHRDGTPYIKTKDGGIFGFLYSELQYIERISKTKKQRIEALEQTTEKQAEQIAELQSTIGKLREALA